MAMKHAAVFLGICLIGSPAFGQAADPHQPWNNGSAADSMTVAPGEVAQGYDPGTRAANLGLGRAPVVAMGEARADYAADQARYEAAIRARHHTIALTDAHYARQQRAYADAMNAWRAQVTACRSGDTRACRSPTPDPAAFY